MSKSTASIAKPSDFVILKTQKLNNVTKTNFFKNANKRSSLFLQHLLEKANHIEFINLKGTTAQLFEKVKNI